VGSGFPNLRRPSAATSAALGVVLMSWVATFVLAALTPENLLGMAPEDVTGAYLTLAQVTTALLAFGVPVLLLAVQRTDRVQISALNAPAAIARSTQLRPLIMVGALHVLKVLIGAVYIRKAAGLFADLVLTGGLTLWIGWALAQLASFELEPSRVGRLSTEVTRRRLARDTKAERETKDNLATFATTSSTRPISGLLEWMHRKDRTLSVRASSTGVVWRIDPKPLTDLAKASVSTVDLYSVVPGQTIAEGALLFYGTVPFDRALHAQIAGCYDIRTSQRDHRVKFVDDVHTLESRVIDAMYDRPAEYEAGLAVLEDLLEMAEKLSDDAGPSATIQLDEVHRAITRVSYAAVRDGTESVILATTSFLSRALETAALERRVHGYRLLLNDLARLYPLDSEPMAGRSQELVEWVLESRFRSLAFRTRPASDTGVVFEMRQSSLWNAFELARRCLVANAELAANRLLTLIEEMSDSMDLGDLDPTEEHRDAEAEYVDGMTLALIGHVLDRNQYELDNAATTRARVDVVLKHAELDSDRLGEAAEACAGESSADYWQSTLRDGPYSPHTEQTIMRGLLIYVFRNDLDDDLRPGFFGLTVHQGRVAHAVLQAQPFRKLLVDLGAPSARVNAAAAKASP